MNIFVVLRAVLDPGGFVVNRKAQKIFVNQAQYRINPADLNALEAGLALAASGAAEAPTVTAVSYGGPEAEEALRQALARGASRALWVQAPELRQADASALVRVLVRVRERRGPADLVLLGAEVADADLAQVGARLAATLGRPFVEAAWQVQAADQRVQAVVKAPAGYEAVEADLPAVVSVARDCNRPRYAPAPAIISVYSRASAVEACSLADLGLSEAELRPLVEVTGTAIPPERELGKQLEGTPEELAQALASALEAGGLSPRH